MLLLVLSRDKAHQTNIAYIYHVTRSATWCRNYRKMCYCKKSKFKMAALLMEMEEKLQKQAFKRVFAELYCFVKHFYNAKTIHMWLQRKRQLELVVPFLPKQNLFVIIFADHWDATWLDFLSVMKWWKEYQRNVFSYVNCWFCETLNYVCSLVVILLDAQPTDNTSIQL